MSDGEMSVPASVRLDDRDYPIRWIACAKCTNWWLTIDLPEHAPSYCCYCGMKFRFYEDGAKTLRDLGDRPL